MIMLSCCEHLQDGYEYWYKMFNYVEEALNFIDGFAERVNRHNLHFRLFNVGDEIPIHLAEETIPQPSKVLLRAKLGVKEKK